MAVRVIVDISDLVRWGKLLGIESVEIANRVRPAVDAEAQAVQGKAESLAPVGATTMLRGSIRKTGTDLRRRVAAGSGKAYYGVFHEFGTAKMPAHPFLITQANQQTLGEFEKRVETATFAGQIYRGEA